MMSYKKLLFFLLLSGLMASCLFQSPQKRAQRKIRKEKFEKATALLQKSLRKDSLNPAASYLFSRLYLDTAFHGGTLRQRVDTAHYYILEAIAELPQADKKDLRRLRKIKADSATLLQQHLRVDSAAFALAAEDHSIAAYDYFLEHYSEALQVDEATARRNALAYKAAEAVHTYQAYQQFFLTYPEAAEVPEARERYEELLFIENTRTGTLSAYIRFLREYPETPYRDRLLKNIYLLSTAGHEPSQYLRYIQQYPESPYSRQAAEQLYHLHKEDGEPAHFAEAYPQLPVSDSLQQVIRLDGQELLAILKDQEWQFINSDGKVILEGFDDIHPDYLCETATADFLEVIRGMQPLVLARSGEEILAEDYQSLRNLGSGLLGVQQNQLQGLYFKNGKRLLPIEYEKIENFGPRFLLVKEAGKYGLLTHHGQWLLEPAYDSLARLENFIMLYQDSLFSVTTTHQLLDDLQNSRSPETDFAYTDAVLANPRHLLLWLPDGRQLVLNQNLQQPFPSVSGEIESFRGGWLTEKEGRYEVLNQDGKNALGATLQQVSIREPWVAYKTDSLWGLYHIDRQVATFDLYDSLALLHPQIIIAEKDQQLSALFFGEQDTVTVDLSGTDSYRLLRAIRYPGIDEAEQVYLLVSNGNAKMVYNQQGKLLTQGRYSEVQAPDNRLLLLKTSGGAHVIDSSGQVLLQSNYDAIGNYQNGNFATLERSRFGLYNPYKNINIPPQYSVALRTYSDSLLLAGKNKLWGIIDNKNKTLLPFEWEELQYWSDTVALGRKNGQWQLVNIKSGELLHMPFKNYQLITQSPEGSMAIIYTESGYGVISSRHGLMVEPTFNVVENMGSASKPLFYAEKKVKEADLYTVLYINEEGKTIFKESYSRQDWLRLLCN